MPRLPLLVRLDGRRCLVVGAGEIGRWKADALAACGARVTIVDPTAALPHRNGGIAVKRRRFRPGDVAGHALVVVATADRDTNRRAAAAARAHRIPLNVVDSPDKSDVIFPSIVNRAPVTVAVSTDGASPVLARQLRRQIEAILPETVGAAARFAAGRRGAVKSTLETAEARRQFWERFFEAFFAAGAPAASKLDGIYRHLLKGSSQGMRAAAPCVHVLEAPARSDRLSLHALRLLNAADTLVFDAAVATEVIDHARREARHHVLRGSAPPSVRRCLAAAAADAKAGCCVLWLRSARHSHTASMNRLRQALAEHGVAARFVSAAPSPSD